MKQTYYLFGLSSKLGAVYLLFFMSIPFAALAQNDYSLEVRALGIAGEEENAFWVRSNTNGRILAETYGLGILSGSYAGYIGEEMRVTAGASGFFRMNREPASTEFWRENRQFESTQARLDQYHVGIAWKKLELRAGAWQRPELLMGISSIGGDILWSNNALPMPGVLLQTTEPIKIVGPFGIEAAYGNYWMEGDRVTRWAKVHYKQLTLNFDIGSEGLFSFGVHHYVQWGGFNTRGEGQQPESLRDYIRVVLGQSGRANASGNDQGNKLGNIVGSYRIGYSHNFREGKLQLYHQTIAEDETGIDGRNFPDGAWGLFYKAKEKSIVQGIVYEYIQTTFQGGPVETRMFGGADNYFNNSIYQDGWTYEGATIGLPYFLVDPTEFGVAVNRVVAHHLGIAGSNGALSYRLRTSYTRNEGETYDRYPVPEKVLYSGLDVQYGDPAWGRLELHLGADLGNLNPNRFTLGLGYSYTFQTTTR